VVVPGVAAVPQPRLGSGATDLPAEVAVTAAVVVVDGALLPEPPQAAATRATTVNSPSGSAHPRLAGSTRRRVPISVPIASSLS
jgi:hypothetical protein